MNNQEFQKSVLDELKALKEDFDTKFEILGMKTDKVSIKVDTLDLKVGMLNKTVDELDKKVDTLDKRVDTLEKTVGTLDKKVESLDKKVESLDKKVESNKVQTKENTRFLQALIRASDERRAIIDRLEIQGAKTQGEVVALRKSLKFVEHQSAENNADIVELKAARA